MLDLASQLAMPIKEVAAITSKSEDGQQPQKTSSPKRPGVTMKDALTKGVGGGSGGVDADELMLEVTCGQNQAALYMSRLQLGSKGTCVLFENAWLTPNEFQYISGRETAKDWKRSIKHHGKSLKVLISKGILTTTPLRCNCGQCSQTKDVSKYIVGDEAKMAAVTMRGENGFITDASKLKSSSESVNDLGDRRFFRIPGESNDKLRDGLMDSPAKAQRPLTEQCLPGHSPDGGRYMSSCDKGLYGTAMVNHGGMRFEGYNPLASSCSPQGGSVGMEMRKTSPDASDAKLKAKKRTDDSDECSKEQFGLRGVTQCNEHRKPEVGCRLDAIDSNPSNNNNNNNGQKRTTTSSSSCIRPSTSTDPNHWGHAPLQADQPSHPDSNNACKLTPHDKSKKSSTLNPATTSASSDRPSCSQLNPTSVKNPVPTNNNAAVDPTRLVPSDPSFLFPSFGSPYYPMMTAPQLPAYYSTPYVWPVPFATAANPSSCSYGWTAPAPSSEMPTPNCLRSPTTKDTHDSSTSNTAAEHSFNFPWMKRTNYSFPSEPHPTRDPTTDPSIPSGKRKLENDSSSDYLPPAKHPFYIHDGLRPTAFTDAMTWPAYNPSMFLPYNLSSYIPEGRSAHSMFANSFLKGADNPAGAGLGLYSGFFPSPCLGVNSR